VIVTDAGVVAEVLLDGPRAGVIRAVLARHREVHVPEHFHVEVLSVLRRYSIRGELSERRFGRALSALADLRTIRYPVIELAETVWDLRQSLTTYDAAYLALARRLNAGLLTLDSGLAAAAGAEDRLVLLTD
jgi:predicted nucleic acid-binding protein